MRNLKFENIKKINKFNINIEDGLLKDIINWFWFLIQK